MPARKNRPGKHGMNSETASTVKERRREATHEERALVDKIIMWERDQPRHDHYVGWPDMDAAERLAKMGYLIEGGVRGCFFVTDAFRETFMKFTTVGGSS